VRESAIAKPRLGRRAGAEPYIPKTSSLRRLAAAVDRCRGCDLYRGATQGVFGAGPRTASLMLVGEQPGDREDLEGLPFVGPAGALLDRALADARIPRAEVYVTNVVKHFKFVRSGKRRIHQTPDSGEIEACRPWLFKELEIVEPEILVCLGATAAKSAFGSGFRVTGSHGQVLESRLAPKTLATIHPSAALRAPDSAARRRLYRQLVGDLRLAALAAAP
jgi:DNA polymerase